MARPNVGYVERARRAARLDASKLSKQLDLPKTRGFDGLVRTAQSALDDYHFWAGLGRHGRDLRLLILEKFRRPLGHLRDEYRHMHEVDAFRPFLDDSPLDSRLAAAIEACDSILAEFRTDHLPDWLGVSREVAKKITGHRTDSVYNRYRIVAHEEIRDVARRLDEARGN